MTIPPYNYDIPFIPNVIEDRIKNAIVVTGQEVFLDLVAEQPWWKRISNTVTVSLTSLFTLLGAAVTFGVIKPTLWVGLAIVALFLIIQIIATKATKNGLTESVGPAIVQANPGWVAQKVLEEVQPVLREAYDRIPDHIQEELDRLRTLAENAKNPKAEGAAPPYSYRRI